jgi:hypothetical protein
MWYYFSGRNITIGLEKVAGSRGQPALDVWKVPENAGAVQIFFGPYWLRLYIGSHAARRYGSRRSDRINRRKLPIYDDGW